MPHQDVINAGFADDHEFQSHRKRAADAREITRIDAPLLGGGEEDKNPT